MQLQRVQNTLASSTSLVNKEELLSKLNSEYDALIAKMTEFYQAKKRLMEMKRKAVVESYDSLELTYKYKELKASLAVQKDRWLHMCHSQLQYA